MNSPQSFPGIGTTTERFAIECVSSMAQLDAMGEAWSELHLCSDDSSIFTSWPWTRAWWSHYGVDSQLRVLVAREGDRLAAILPLHLSTRHVLGLPVRVLAFIGWGGDTRPDYLGPICRAVDAEEMARAFARALFGASRDWDVMHLTDLAQNAPSASALVTALRENGARISNLGTNRIRYCALPGSWEVFLSGLSAHRRQHVRNIRSKAERTAGARFMVVRDPQELDRYFELLAQLHRRRFSARDGGHSFASEQYLGFHRDAIRSCTQFGWVRFYVLMLEDEPAAILYCYLFRGRVHLFQVGMEPRRMGLRPGSVLIGYSIENAIGEGAREFDFLRGDHPYKEEWAKLQRTTEDLLANGGSVAGFLYLLRRKHLPSARRRLLRFWKSVTRSAVAEPHDD
jgi:CelD/BcsL family acetyltransferase involved in cellulose biosynthesis